MPLKQRKVSEKCRKQTPPLSKGGGPPNGGGGIARFGDTTLQSLSHAPHDSSRQMACHLLHNGAIRNPSVSLSADSPLYTRGPSAALHDGPWQMVCHLLHNEAEGLSLPTNVLKMTLLLSGEGFLYPYRKSFLLKKARRLSGKRL